MLGGPSISTCATWLGSEQLVDIKGGGGPVFWMIEGGGTFGGGIFKFGGGTEFILDDGKL